jgi:hypothetical protein
MAEGAAIAAGVFAVLAAKPASGSNGEKVGRGGNEIESKWRDASRREALR